MDKQTNNKVSIALANPKGGVGKTELSMHLRAAIKNGFQTTYDELFDNEFFNAERAKTASKKGVEPELAPVFQAFTHNYKENGEIDTTNNFAPILDFQQSQQDANFIFDLGGYDSQDHRVVLATVDHIIIPTNNTLSDIQSLKLMNQILMNVSHQAERKIVGKVLLSRIDPRSKPSSKNGNFARLYDLVEGYEHLEMLDTVIEQRADFYKSIDDGYSVLEHPKYRGGRAARQIKALVNELNLPANF